MPLSFEICQAFFTEALNASARGESLSITLPNEGRAIRHRFDLHRWRNENRDSLPEEASKLILRVFPREPGDKLGPYLLEASLDSDTEEFTQALEASLGRKIQEPKTAQELFLESLDEKG